MNLHKTAMTILGPLLIYTLLFAWCSSASETASGSSILGVRNFMQNADKHIGIVEVEGVVSQITPSKNLFALIDTEEFKECKVVTCARLRLPVSWEGELPTIYEVIRVKGEIGKRDGGRLFIAKELKKMGQMDEKE